MAQIGAIRGLTSAFLLTEDEKYRDAARKVYAAMDDKLWDDTIKAYKTNGDEASYDAFHSRRGFCLFFVWRWSI